MRLFGRTGEREVRRDVSSCALDHDDRRESVVNVLCWHVHGSWMTAFVHGHHRYYIPVVEGRGRDGLGRAQTWDWPPAAIEVGPEEIGDLDLDVVVLQRPRDVELCEQWVKRPTPRVYVEHDIPMALPAPRHAMADRDDMVIAHVTHLNRLLWDCGSTETTVIDHGVVDPGHRYRGDVEAVVSVINEPCRRWWESGSEVVENLRRSMAIDLFGIDSEPLGGCNLAQARLHDEMARRRAYLHTFRWTSLGLTLIEAMQLGMPVAALACTEAPTAVPAGAGLVTNDVAALEVFLRSLLAEPARAVEMGAVARNAALERFGLDRFLRDWDHLLARVV